MALLIETFALTDMLMNAQKFKEFFKSQRAGLLPQEQLYAPMAEYGRCMFRHPVH